MIGSFTSAAMVAALLNGSVLPGHAPDQLVGLRSVRVTAEAFAASATMGGSQVSSPQRDSLTNGAIIGAIVGAATGAVLAAVGCGLAEISDGGDSSGCAGGTALLIGIGAGAGALIGVGVDALFEQGPSAGLPAGGKRVGVRVRFAF
jgi:hypothetical protein